MYSQNRPNQNQEWSLGPGIPRRSRQYGSSIDDLIETGKKYAPLVLALGAGVVIGYAASFVPSIGKELPLSGSYGTIKK